LPKKRGGGGGGGGTNTAGKIDVPIGQKSLASVCQIHCRRSESKVGRFALGRPHLYRCDCLYEGGGSRIGYVQSSDVASASSYDGGGSSSAERAVREDNTSELEETP